MANEMTWSRLEGGPNAGSYRAFVNGQKWEISPTVAGWVLFEGNYHRGVFPTVAAAQEKAANLPKRVTT